MAIGGAVQREVAMPDPSPEGLLRCYGTATPARPRRGDGLFYFWSAATGGARGGSASILRPSVAWRSWAGSGGRVASSVRAHVVSLPCTPAPDLALRPGRYYGTASDQPLRLPTSFGSRRDNMAISPRPSSSPLLPLSFPVCQLLLSRPSPLKLRCICAHSNSSSGRDSSSEPGSHPTCILPSGSWPWGL